MYRLTTTFPRTTPRALSTRLLTLQPQLRHNSNASNTSYPSNPNLVGFSQPEKFTKTGSKEQNPNKHVSPGSEYSQSGGDEMVAAQGKASFEDRDATPEKSKETAGKGNVVNPLEFSPASPGLSAAAETVVSQNEERDASQHTGQGITRKAKTVEKTKIDFK